MTFEDIYAYMYTQHTGPEHHSIDANEQLNIK